MYFLNPFPAEFKGNWVLSDRQQSLTFTCPPNTGRSAEEFRNWADGPYDLTGNDSDGQDKSLLTIYYAIDLGEFKNWSALSVNVESGAVSSSAVTAREIVTFLNADVTFASLFEASLSGDSRINIRQKRDSTRMKSYIGINGAETVLKFNARAGVGDLPVYFMRHSIESRFTFNDSLNHLIRLNDIIVGNTVANPTVVNFTYGTYANSQTVLIAESNSTPTIDGSRVISSYSAGAKTFTVPVNVTVAGDRGFIATGVMADIVNNAVDARGVSLGLTAAGVKSDWELLRGRSGLFTCQKLTVDGSDRVTEIIEYQSGALTGDLGRKIKYTYTGALTKPSTIAEIPYTLKSTDLISIP